jgi:hypothetical protein
VLGRKEHQQNQQPKRGCSPEEMSSHVPLQRLLIPNCLLCHSSYISRRRHYGHAAQRSQHGDDDHKQVADT